MKKKASIIAGIVAGVAITLLICRKLDYLYVSYDPWYRMLFHSYYDQDSIDNLFIGSSHVFCDVNPEVLDSINKKNNFNISTYGQRSDVTYYLLKDAISRYDIENVYIECYYSTLSKRRIWNGQDKIIEETDMIDDAVNYSRKWLISYDMKPSEAMVNILTSTMDSGHAIESLFPFVRYRENVFDWDQVRKNIADKESEEYKNYSYHTLNKYDGYEIEIEYRNKGYYYSSGKKILGSEKFSEREQHLGIGDKSSEFLRKSIELCKENNINVKLFISPVYDLNLISFGEYDDYLDELADIVQEYDVELYDFNLIKDSYLDIKKDEYFMDISHLNGQGAEKYTPVLYDVLSSSKEDNACKFFDSYVEKLEEEEPVIYGVYYDYYNPDEETDSTGYPIYTLRRCKIASNRDGMKYKIIRTVKGKDNISSKKIIVQDYDSNMTFDIPVEDSGTIEIIASAPNGEGEMMLSLDYEVE